ncbi:creatininase family protein [Phormidium tenue]|uniref:Creatinine amidohydrolase n=1 Tax=Phormidium tenue NIES-30 TaxID=549789 RepID=A0A1U7JA67_9CYAN|nr:creatininase family protein [Phormidium tenue]MBD2230558.1 creatininase family protein [Phormidium tenue FACHB-1052]OKH50667.1 creatinine amidohydrolase [Phormidium tenue NIES-30]
MHGPIPPHRYFAYLTWTDIEAMPERANAVIVQPMGAIEQHGPHLPLAVDSAICTTVLGNALAQLDDAVPVYSLPPLYYGKSNEHWHFPGTITLSAETLLKVIYDVAESIYRAGFRKLVLLNAHGGQPQVLEIAARDLHQVHDDLMVFPLFVWAVPNCAGDLLTPKEMELGIHAGDAETSLMLSILPEQVRMAEAKAEFPQNLPTDSWLTMEGALPFAWVTRDLSASGVLGDPTMATGAKGEQLLTSLATSWATALEDIYRFRQPHTDSAYLP